MGSRLGAGGSTPTDGLPSGSVTFLFTDIEGSTRIVQRAGDGYEALLSEHRAIIRAGVEAGGGHVVGIEGDGCFAVFGSPLDAVRACARTQSALVAASWPDGLAVKVRMGLHTGEARPTEAGDYIALAVHQASRVGAAGHGGQILLSSATASIVTGLLPDALELRRLGSYRLKDFPQSEVIHQLMGLELASDFPPLRLLGARVDLPAFRTSFVGRHDELVALAALVSRPGLVTVTGPGGVGKTRLAVEAAAAAADLFGEGVRFVDLTKVTDDAQVAAAVAFALGVRDSSEMTTTDALIQALAGRELLLVLDNCEHVLDAAARVTDALLDGCPQITILATSREAMALGGEQTWPLAPLRQPEDTGAMADLLAADTVRLFGERAKAADPTFSLDSSSGAAVADICRRLDGLPLAIELAAASVRLMTPTDLAARLADGLPLPARSGRLAPARQRTLRSVFEWSFALLSDAERALLRRLSVFRGTWTADAVEAVCAGDGLHQHDVVPGLANLVEKSLVVFDNRDSGSRFRLLETVRSFSGERLVAADEDERVQQAHAEWMAAFATEQSALLIGPGAVAAVVHFDNELANLRAALEWSTKALPQTFLAVCLGAARYWLDRGLLSEGRDNIERALAIAPADSPEGAGLAAYGARFAIAQGDYEGALALAGRAEGGALEVSDPGLLARALQVQADVALRQGQTTEGRALFEKSLPLAMASGQGHLEVVSLQGLGTADANDARWPSAQRWLRQGLERARQIDDATCIAAVLGSLGEVLLQEEKVDEAASLFEDELGMARATRNPRLVGYALGDVSNVAVKRGDLPRARQLLEEAQALGESIGDRQAVIRSQIGLGQIARLLDHDFVAANEHLEAALAEARAVGIMASVQEAIQQLAMAAWDSGDKEAAKRRLIEAVVELRGTDVLAHAIFPLIVIAELDAADGNAERAARLLGAAAGLAGTEGEAGEDTFEGATAARQVLGDEGYDAAWRHGRDLPFAAVIDLLA